MENKRWIIVILLLIGGAVTIREGLKSMSWMHPDSDATQIDLGMQPFLSPAVHRKTKYQVHRGNLVSQNLQKPCLDPDQCEDVNPQGDLDHNEKANEDKMKKKDKNKSKGKNEVNKKKKTDKDKKKKKKKKGKKKTSKNRKKRSSDELADSNDPSQTSSNTETDPSSPHPQELSTIVTHNANDKKNDKKDDQNTEEQEEQLLETWRADLLTKPNPEKVNEFIDLYLIRKIPENVYYTLALEMVFDERTEMISYGVLCLGSTPSVRSFNELVTIESNSETPDWAKSDASRYLQSYTQLHHVRLLTRILMQSNTNSIAIRTAQLLRSSAQRNISSLRSPTSQSSEETTDQAELSRSIESYNDALSTLTRLRESQDNEVKDAMGQAYDTISSLLNG